MDRLVAKVTSYAAMMQGLNCCDGQRHRFFVYGTLKRGQPNAHHFSNPENGKARFVGTAYTDKAFPLVIATRWNLPFLLWAPDHGKVIHGEVYDVDESMMAFMDDFEGHPEVYEREKIKVFFTDPAHTAANASKTTECWVYFLKQFPPGLLGKPSIGNYDAYGDHGKLYIEDEDLSGPDNIYEALQEEC